MSIAGQIFDFQNFNQNEILRNNDKLVYDASIFFQNMNNYMEKLQEEISIFGQKKLKSEIVYSSGHSWDEKSFFYRKTDESIKDVNNFKEKISLILSKYYDNYLNLKNYFNNFEKNVSETNNLIGYLFQTGFIREYNDKKNVFQPIYFSMESLKNNLHRQRMDLVLLDLESLIKNADIQDLNVMGVNSKNVFEKMNSNIGKMIEFYKNSDTNSMEIFLDELEKNYNELVAPLREQFIQISSFEDEFFRTKSNFVHMINDCQKNTERLIKAINSLSDNLYENGFGEEFPCNLCDKKVIDEPMGFSMDKKNTEKYIRMVKDTVSQKLSSTQEFSSISEFSKHMKNLFNELKKENMPFFHDKYEFIDSVREKSLLPYNSVPSEIIFTKKEYEVFSKNIAKDACEKIGKKIAGNMEKYLIKEKINPKDIRYLEKKYMDFEAWFMKKTGLFKKNIEKNLFLEFLIEGKNGLEFQVKNYLRDIESSKECYVWYEKDKRFSLLRKDLHHLPEEIENFEKELVISKMKPSNDAWEEKIIDEMKNKSRILTMHLNKFKGIPWLKDLGEEAFINEQLILDKLRYVFSQKKNFLCRFFDFAGDKIKEEFYELKEYLAEKLNIPKRTLEKLDFELSDILAIRNRVPKSFAEFSEIINDSREKHYLAGLKKRGVSSPGKEVASKVSKRPDISRIYEIKYMINDIATEPAKKFLEKKVGEPVKKFLLEKIGEPAKNYVVNKWNALKSKLEKDENDKLALLEKIESFIDEKITNPWYKRYSQLDRTAYDSLKSWGDRNITTEQLHSQLPINSKPKHGKNLAELAVDAMDKFKESKKRQIKAIDASSNDPIILAKMDNDYCRPCFETLKKKEISLNPKKLISETMRNVVEKKGLNELLKNVFIPLICAKDEKIALIYEKKYYGKVPYEPEPGYGLYELLEIKP